MSIHVWRAQVSEDQQANNLVNYHRLDQFELHRIFQMRSIRAERARTCRHEFMEPIHGRAESWCLRCVYCAGVISLQSSDSRQVGQERLL